MSEIKNVSKVVLANEKIFTDAEEWLESIGVNFNNTRFGNSRRIYNNWINGDQILNLKNLWAFAEFTDLAELARLFKDSSEIESFFLKRISSGTNFIQDENKTIARDLFFEAKTAARFKRAGFNILPDKSHDVVVEKNGLMFGVECKRPSSYDKLIKLIKFAYKSQLNKLPNRNEQGVIFIDLSRILYTRFAEYLRLSESDLPFSNEVILQRFRDDFDTEIKNLIQKKAHKVASGVAMIVIHYRFPLLIDGGGDGDGDGDVCNYLTFNHFCMMFGNDSDKVKFLASSMRGSVGNQFL